MCSCFSLTMTCILKFGLLLVVVSRFAFSEFMSSDGDQKADGSFDFKYFNREAEDVAKRLLGILPKVDESIQRYVNELKHSSSVANALNKYNTWVTSVKGSHCNVDNYFTGAQDQIDTIVDTCVAISSRKDVDNLKEITKVALIKNQIADNNLRKNAEMCFSQEAIPSSACAEEKIIALNSIRSILDDHGKAYIEYYFRKAFFNSKLEIDPCVEAGAKDLQKSLKTATKRIEKCFDTYK